MQDHVSTVYYQKIGTNQEFITHGQWAHAVLGAIIVGILMGYSSYYPMLSQMLYILAIGIALMIASIIKALQSSYRFSSLIKVCLILSIAMGLSYYHIQQSIINYNQYSSYYLQQEGEYLVTVISSPDRTIIDGQEYYKYTVELRGVHPYKETAKNCYINAKGRLQVYSKSSTNREPIQLGEQAIVIGTPKALFLVDEEGRISLRGRYMSSNIRGRIYDGIYRVANANDIQRFNYVETLFERIFRNSLRLCGHLRQSIERNIDTYLEGSENVLAQSLSLGGHYSELGDERMKDFAYTGLIHILSISGSHIALLISLIYGIGRVAHIRKKTCLILGIIVACFYCGIVGGDAPIIRATMMSFFMCIAYIKGRIYEAKQALCICAILCITVDPFCILDVSFQLSFGATYGLLIWGKLLYDRIQWLPSWLKAPLILCVSAQLLILPLQLYYFHYISMVSVFAASIVAPILDICIILIFICTLISYLIPLSCIWIVLKLLLSVSLYLIHVLGRSSGLLWLGIMDLYCVYFYYLCLGFFTYYLKYRTRNTVCLIVSLACMISMFGCSYYVTRHHKDVLVHYIPMKQCNVLLCISQNHKDAYLLVDAPDYIKTVPNERLIYQTIRAYGVDPRTVKVKYFHSNGTSNVIYTNDMKEIYVYNGQRGEKNLKLKDKTNTLFITNQSRVLNDIVSTSPCCTVLVSSPHGALRDIDPASECIFIMGYSYIKDMYL